MKGVFCSCAKNELFELAGYLSSRNKSMFWTLDPFFWGLFLHGHLLIQGTPSIQNFAHLFIREACLIGLPCSQVPMDKSLLEPSSCDEQSQPGKVYCYLSPTKENLICTLSGQSESFKSFERGCKFVGIVGHCCCLKQMAIPHTNNSMY